MTTDRLTHGLRTRVTYLGLAIGTIAIGLAVHFHGSEFPSAFRDVLADALWAGMINWLVALASPAMPLPARTAIALAICFAVELAQLYHAPWIDAVRHLSAGHMVLGTDFDPRDLAAYTAGVLTAVLLERAIRFRSAVR